MKGRKDWKVCRICFAKDVRLYYLYDYMKLYHMYEDVTGLLIAGEENLPPYVCPVCIEKLMSYANFRNSSLVAHMTLLGILKNHGYANVM